MRSQFHLKIELHTKINTFLSKRNQHPSTSTAVVYYYTMHKCKSVCRFRINCLTQAVIKFIIRIFIYNFQNVAKPKLKDTIASLAMKDKVKKITTTIKLATKIVKNIEAAQCHSVYNNGMNNAVTTDLVNQL